MFGTKDLCVHSMIILGPMMKLFHLCYNCDLKCCPNLEKGCLDDLFPQFGLGEALVLRLHVHPNVEKRKKLDVEWLCWEQCNHVQRWLIHNIRCVSMFFYWHGNWCKAAPCLHYWKLCKMSFQELPCHRGCLFFIWGIVVHIMQGFVMFHFVKKFHNSAQWHNIAFCERKKRFLLSIFHLIHFLNAMFDHMVRNIPSAIS